MASLKFLILLATLFVCMLLLEVNADDKASKIQTQDTASNTEVGPSSDSAGREKKWTLRYLPPPIAPYYRDPFGRITVNQPPLTPYHYPRYILERHPGPRDYQFYYY